MHGLDHSLFQREKAGSRPRVALALAVVFALHLAAIVGLSGAWKTARIAAPAPRVSLRLIPLALPPALPPPARPTAARPALPSAAMHPRKAAPSVPRDVREPVAIASAITPEPAASAPEPLPSLMDTDATRRAIRASAREPSLGDQLAQSREEKPRLQSPNDRLARGVHSAGKGDCMKGEYAGANMGLLSLPFLAIALTAGDCAK